MMQKIKTRKPRDAGYFERHKRIKNLAGYVSRYASVDSGYSYPALVVDQTADDSSMIMSAIRRESYAKGEAL